MKKITYDIEWTVERSHWWFTGRRRLLKYLLSSLGIQQDSPILDVGCGVGSNLDLLKSMGFEVIGIDSEIYSLGLAKRRLSTSMLLNGSIMNLPIKSNSIGIIIATDILEHLIQDTGGIHEIHRTLKHGGKVIFTVPAFRFLWGIQDVVGKHIRRYSKMELTKKIEEEGFKILKSSYFNFFIFVPILLGRRLIHIFGLKIESENEINSPIINFFLKSIFSLEPYLLKYFSFPFGVSIFCIAQK
jgi:ubiquinone/menaquinone biosynthesis C-methylase UbiE